MVQDVVGNLFQQEVEPDPELIAAVRDSVRAFARSRKSLSVSDPVEQQDWEWQQIAHAGWLGLLAPEEQGGAALTVPVLAALYEALGESGVVEAYESVGVLSLVALQCCEPSLRRDGLVKQLISGSARPILCWQGEDGGDETRLTFSQANDSDGVVVLSDRRSFVERIDSATHFCFPVEWGGRYGLFVIDHRAQGLDREAATAMSGDRIGSISFTGSAPASEFLPLTGPSLQPAFLLGRIAAAAHLAGLATRIVELTSGYLVQRIQFGKPIASNQVVQHRLVDMWGQTELARAAVARAATSCSYGMVEAERAALAAKARAGAAAEFVTKWAFQLHGAIGYTEEYELGRLARACLALVPWLGSPRQARRRFVELERGGGREA